MESDWVYLKSHKLIVDESGCTTEYTTEIELPNRDIKTSATSRQDLVLNELYIQPILVPKKHTQLYIFVCFNKKNIEPLLWKSTLLHSRPRLPYLCQLIKAALKSSNGCPRKTCMQH